MNNQTNSNLESMPPEAAVPQPAAANRPWVRRWYLMVLLMLVVHGVGLTRDLSEPWWGLQDWNGAFFSQLARNHARYPWSFHHGMPVVAVGGGVPLADEYSIYSTHPPGVVWLLAGCFRLLGESEAVARLLPITFSLGAFAGLVWLVRRGWGLPTAFLFGAIYAVLPMSVYFGRMVDHEAICLACAVAVLVGYAQLKTRAERAASNDGASAPRRPVQALGTWALLLCGLILGIWIDWFGVLFGGVFCVSLLVTDLRSRALRSGAIIICAVALVSLISMMSFIVYAGLDGQWSDLLAIFTSRAGERTDIAGGRAAGQWWRYVVDNLTAPVLVLALLGLPALLRGRSTDPAGSDAAAGHWAARRGIGLLTLSGAIWLGLFWQQFQRHEYWMFYVGPVAVLAAAQTIASVWQTGIRHNLKATRWAAIVMLAATLVYEIRAIDDLYARQDRPPAEIADWQAIHAQTNRAERVVLFENPIRIEQRGGYQFRNIVPPQLAYYLDRPFTVTGRISDLPSLADSHVVFVRPHDLLLQRRLTESEREILARLPSKSLNLQVVYELGR